MSDKLRTKLVSLIIANWKVWQESLNSDIVTVALVLYQRDEMTNICCRHRTITRSWRWLWPKFFWGWESDKLNRMSPSLRHIFTFARPAHHQQARLAAGKIEEGFGIDGSSKRRRTNRGLKIKAKSQLLPPPTQNDTHNLITNNFLSRLWDHLPPT